MRPWHCLLVLADNASADRAETVLARHPWPTVFAAAPRGQQRAGQPHSTRTSRGILVEEVFELANAGLTCHKAPNPWSLRASHSPDDRGGLTPVCPGQLPCPASTEPTPSGCEYECRYSQVNLTAAPASD